jgi:hypothetical protein
MARGGATDILPTVPHRGAIAAVVVICISPYRYLRKVRWL